MDAIFFNLASRYFWIVCLVVNLINAVIFKVRSQSHIRQDPSLASGYTTLIQGFLICSSLPWLAMGFGIMVGNVPTIWYFLYPGTGNPYVVAWWVVYWLTISFVSQWIVLRGGAEMMVKYPGFLRGNSKNPRTIKLTWLLMLAGTAAFTIIMFNQAPPAEPSYFNPS
ncbi:MAG: hypothetical protein F6K30_21995 [Cyanothece sp. SIO2G6]|nr:hypothetical protein [Cyanothece sp. SIO2G6]